MRIVLADEISPDCCRLWDAATSDKLDKDRFRRDLGGVLEAYQEVARRLGVLTENPRPKGSGPGAGQLQAELTKIADGSPLRVAPAAAEAHLRAGLHGDCT